MQHNTRQIFRNAWALARQGATQFGGSSRQYFQSALQLAWAEAKAITVQNEILDADRCVATLNDDGTARIELVLESGKRVTLRPAADVKRTECVIIDAFEDGNFGHYTATQAEAREFVSNGEVVVIDVEYPKPEAPKPPKGKYPKGGHEGKFDADIDRCGAELEPGKYVRCSNARGAKYELEQRKDGTFRVLCQHCNYVRGRDIYRWYAVENGSNLSREAAIALFKNRVNSKRFNS